MSPSRSPLEEGLVHVTVLADGQRLPQTVLLQSATVRHAFDDLPSATLVFGDGDLVAARWPMADDSSLVPGTGIEIRAGYGDQEDRLFAGKVMRVRVGQDSTGSGRLTVECQDPAGRMDVVPRSTRHLDSTDAEALATLVASHGLSADIPATPVRHGALVQHRCTDWQFLCSRARALGRVVNVAGGHVRIHAPDTSAAAVLKVTWGSDLIDFEAELDARWQFESVRAAAWDARTQAMVPSRMAPPWASPLGSREPGNLDSASLAGALDLGPVDLPATGPADSAGLDARAWAQQWRSGMSRLRGRLRLSGSALAVPGALIEVAGLGQRFNGNALASAVTHHLQDGTWTTDVGFGLPPGLGNGAADEQRHPSVVGRSGPASGADVILAPGAPAHPALHIGVVTKLESDPAGDHRVQVSMPAAGLDGVWARLMQPRASRSFGAFVVPEIGDEVLLGFLDDDPGSPVVLGSLYSQAHPPAETLSDENAITAFQTRSGLRLRFDDRDGAVSVTTAQGHELRLDDRRREIFLRDSHGHELRMNADGLHLSSQKDLRIEASGTVTIAAGSGLQLGAVTDLKLQGLNITAQAQVTLAARGGASAELSAAGTTQVRGTMVMIN